MDTRKLAIPYFVFVERGRFSSRPETLGGIFFSYLAKDSRQLALIIILNLVAMVVFEHSAMQSRPGQAFWIAFLLHPSILCLSLSLCLHWGSNFLFFLYLYLFCNIVGKGTGMSQVCLPVCTMKGWGLLVYVST